MDITDVRIKKVNSDNKIKAIASVTFDNEFVVREIKVLEGRDGELFIAMPSRKINLLVNIEIFVIQLIHQQGKRFKVLFLKHIRMLLKLKLMKKIMIVKLMNNKKSNEFSHCFFYYLS